MVGIVLSLSSYLLGQAAHRAYPSSLGILALELAMDVFHGWQSLVDTLAY